MDRKRYESDMDAVQQQATQRARASLHPDVAAARERRGQPESSTPAPEEPVREKPPGVLQRISGARPMHDAVMGHKQSPQATPAVRKTALAELQHSYGQEA